MALLRHDERPPVVIGYRERPFLTTGASVRYYCGADARPVGWPSVMVPIWRGEVPAHAECEVCGMALTEFE